ncbi:winged helix-turn-helix transcriptional regulator [Amycolatopsis sp. NPDC051903]|uniref:winged helix-turn-helix transcriptional regulator n=1 Tax=Amycolatopsis sp. NPDC051903 TaxID=3363936 RepID=UPI0037B143A7
MQPRRYNCGLDAAIDVIGGRWKSLVLWALHEHPLRFGELKRRVSGISEKMLTESLRELEHDGIVHREAYPEIPPRVEYSLTERGQALNTALLTLGDWGEQNMHHIAERRGVLPAPRH